MSGAISGAAMGGAFGVAEGYASRSRNIVFGNNENQQYHTFRHVDELELNREDVINAIELSIKKLGEIPVSQPINRIVIINGVKLQYTVYKLKNGTLNVGRIHEVK